MKTHISYLVLATSNILRNLRVGIAEAAKNSRVNSHHPLLSRYSCSRLWMATTIQNNNTPKDTKLTLIALIPVIPGGFVMALRYLFRIDVTVLWNWMRMYSERRHARYFKEFNSGMELDI